MPLAAALARVRRRSPPSRHAAHAAPLAGPARHHRGGHRTGVTLAPSRAARSVARAASPLDDVRAGDLISLDFGDDDDNEFADDMERWALQNPMNAPAAADPGNEAEASSPSGEVKKMKDATIWV